MLFALISDQQNRPHDPLISDQQNRPHDPCASRTAGARPHLQHRVRRLIRRSDIRDALVESFLTRRQQHRRPLDPGRLPLGSAAFTKRSD